MINKHDRDNFKDWYREKITRYRMGEYDRDILTTVLILSVVGLFI